MATWIEDDWHNQADGDSPAESAQVAAKNSSLECDIDVSVTLARTNYAAASKRIGPYVELTSEKSGLSLDDDSILDGDLDKDFPPGDSGLLLPELLDVTLPKTINADPLDLSLSDEVLLNSPLLRKPLETIEEEPELEAQMELEHPPERNPEELSTHMEDEPAPLVLDALPPLQDPELCVDPANDPLRDPSEPHLQASAQSLAESAVPPRPESSLLSLKDEEPAREAAPPPTIVQDSPPRPKSPYQARNRPTVSSVQTQATAIGEPPSTRAGAEKLATAAAESRPPPSISRSPLGGRRRASEAPSSRPLQGGAEATVVTKGQVASQFLEKIGQLRGAAVLAEGGHDTYTLAEDLMSIEGAQKQLDKCKKEEFGELFTKRPVNTLQGPSKLTAEADSDEEESALDFDHLPIRRRMDIWKRREHRAIRKGLIVIPKMSKQGRFPISAAGL
ncbi:uncharacterized protein LOC144140993 isoform X1 [Haemaphysalis longicornis]